MTVVSPIQRNDYIGSGTTGPFAYSFRIFAAADLRVTKASPSGALTTLAYLVDYTVTGVGEGNGGSITLTAPLANGYALAIQRVPAIQQARSIRNQGAYNAAVVEDMVDYLTMIDLAQQDAIDRSFKAPTTVPPSSIDTDIRAFLPGYYLRVRNDGSGLEGVRDVVADQNFIQSGAGAVVRSANSKMAEVVSVTDFGAVADGSPTSGTDLGAAFTLAVAALPPNGGVVVIPPGTYYQRTSGIIPTTFPDGAQIVIARWGARIYTDKAISLIKRTPANQTEAESAVGARVVVLGGHTSGTRLANQKDIDIGATYASLFIGGQSETFDYGLDLQFCLDAQVSSWRTGDCRTYGIAIRAGQWTGATVINAQSNHVQMLNCRDYARTGMTASFAILGCDGVFIQTSITEGGNPVNNILFDQAGSTVVKSFTVMNHHAENTPTNAIVKIKAASGIVLLDRIFYQTSAVLCDGTESQGAEVQVRNIPYIAGAPLFSVSGTSGYAWYFENVGGSIDLTDASYWAGGVVPIGVRVYRAGQAEFTESVPVVAGYATLRQAFGGVNYDKGHAAPLTNLGYDLGFWTNAVTNSSWRRGIFGGLVTGFASTKTADYDATVSDSFIPVDTTGGSININLPDTATPKGTTYSVKLVAGANNVVVRGKNGLATIDGAGSKTWNTPWGGFTFVYDGGSNYYII